MAKNAPEPIDIFIVWDMEADSWAGRRHVESIHLTLEGAEATVPDNIRTPTYKREPDESYVANYTYLAIEKRRIS